MIVMWCALCMHKYMHLPLTLQVMISILAYTIINGRNKSKKWCKKFKNYHLNQKLTFSGTDSEPGRK